jgi:hypothetical protein
MSQRSGVVWNYRSAQTRLIRHAHVRTNMPGKKLREPPLALQLLATAPRNLSLTTRVRPGTFTPRWNQTHPMTMAERANSLRLWK